ncbi:MAG: hypothetical protein WD771_08565 [Gemmatimonadaceae bacterium]
MEQLIIVLLILLFTGGDYFVRWARKRAAGTPPAAPSAARRGRRVAVPDEEEDDEEDWIALVRKGRDGFEPSVLFPRPVTVRPSAPPRAVPFVLESLEPPAPRPAAPLPPPARRAGARLRGIPARDWIKSSRDARRGIVLMTILGTPRGLE